MMRTVCVSDWHQNLCLHGADENNGVNGCNIYDRDICNWTPIKQSFLLLDLVLGFIGCAVKAWLALTDPLLTLRLVHFLS